MKTYHIYLLFLITYFGLVACTSDEVITKAPETKADLQFSLHNDFSRLGTNENSITQIQVLVFSKQGAQYVYQYYSEGSSIVTIGNQTTFHATVQSSNSATKIYVIANISPTVIETIPSGITEQAVKKLLKENFTTSGMFGSFPQWGEHVFVSGIATGSSTVTNINVLRAIARADILVNQVQSIFVIQSVQVYRANQQLQVIPDSVNQSFTVTAPSVPLSSSTSIHTQPIIVNDASLVDSLYLPESNGVALVDQVSKATCLVVGGRYIKNNSSAGMSYYRIDFVDNVNEQLVGQLLRNHQYSFSITNITAPGWPTPDEAANNPTNAIETTVIDWTDLPSEINIANNRYFKITARQLSLEKASGSKNQLLVQTNIPHYTIQWSDIAGNLLGSASRLIENDHFRVTVVSDGIQVEALKDNTSGALIEDYVLIEAERAQIIIKVQQDFN